MRERRTLPELPTFAGGVLTASPTNGQAPPVPGAHGRDRHAGKGVADAADTRVATCEVVVRLPAPIARRWRASALGSDLEPADVIALLLHRHRRRPADLRDAMTTTTTTTAGPAAGTSTTVTLGTTTLAALDRLRDAMGAADRSALCAALLSQELDALVPTE